MSKKLSLKDLVISALFAAVCCVFSIITIPTGIIPVTLGLLGIFATSLILGTKRGIIAVSIFILIGAIGFPVFSGMKGGISILAGPTGGYIYSFIAVAIIVGLFSKPLDGSLKGSLIAFGGCLIGLVACYAIGTAHFMITVPGKGLGASLAVCVYPFIPFDIGKAILAIIIAPRLKKIVNK